MGKGMNSMDKLAIVVPCYNEEEMLKMSSAALREELEKNIRAGEQSI